MTKMPIDEEKIILAIAEGQKLSLSSVQSAIRKGRCAETLGLEEIAAIALRAEFLEEELFSASSEVREAVYGKRMILFAPLYWSDFCVNNCLYCGFRRENTVMNRKRLGAEEAVREVAILVSKGYRRLLLESGEDPTTNHIEHLCDIMTALYGMRDANERACIDRINVNIAATTHAHYKKLLDAGIGTYNLFQETYHRHTYERMHPSGPKHNYLRQILAHDNAMEAGIGDVGLGVLWGLYDWMFELLALVAHARYLEEKFTVGPHTVSVPRIRPAAGIHFAPPYPVPDRKLLYIIAVLRLALPYAGIVISTRESPELRKKSFKIGVTQTSAGSSAEVGGYSARDKADSGQFVLGDHRDLETVIQELIRDDFIPAFCTACEQRGRTGVNFARIARSGFIGKLCEVNSILALKQYVTDGVRSGFVGTETSRLADAFINRKVEVMAPFMRVEVKKSLLRIERGALAKGEYI